MSEFKRREPASAGQQDASRQLAASMEEVFNTNAVRHAYYELLSKWGESNLPIEARKTLFCVPEAIVGSLGETPALEFFGKFTAESTPILKEVRDAEIKNQKESKKEPGNAWEREQELNKMKREAAEVIWNKLSQQKTGQQNMQEAIKTRRDKTAPEATDDDLKTAAYEFFNELYRRTNRR